MRFLLYNIRYGTGGRRRLFPWSGYLGRTRTNLEAITGFIKSADPDIVGLVEVDAGSYRSCGRNQAELIAKALGHYHTYSSKYHQFSFAQLLPVINQQGNAFLSRDTIHNQQFHFFDKGVKKLVIELELENMTVFLVHLALSSRVRHSQLGDLYELVRGTQKPHIVAGDFNAFWGEKEMRLFLAATGLVQGGGGRALPTYPSWAPRLPLDFVLCSADIEVKKMTTPSVLLSDHLPLVCDFEIRR